MTTNQDVARLWQRGETSFSNMQWPAARSAFESAIALDPGHVPSLLRLTSILRRQGHYRAARGTVLQAHAQSPDDPQLIFNLAKLLAHFNEFEALVKCVAKPVFLARSSAQMLAEAGALLSVAAGANQEALELLDLALERDPNNLPALYFRGTLQMFFGDLDGAERYYEKCLELSPNFGQPSWTLAGLRVQTRQSNHIERIKKQLANPKQAVSGQTYLSFALFKELHDLGRHAEAWDALERGFRLKRQISKYDHAATQSLFRHVQAQFTPQFCRQVVTVPHSLTPVFIVGMFRSGTTLLEQILGGHSKVTDGGETMAFAAQLRLATDVDFRYAIDEKAIGRAPAIDYPQLGRSYLDSSVWRARGKPFLTEKLPSNFVNVGFIAKALPQAKILHLVRDPMDTCFSNLRVLFSEAAGYSYDQNQMADYFIWYRQLMAHWHQVLPGRVYDVSYSDLVQQPEDTVRKIMDYCGLSFESRSLAFSESSKPVATASAALIRTGVQTNRSAIWRHYQTQLEPLRRRLADAGLVR